MEETIKKDLRDKWLEKMKKNKKPGTCKSYLGSLARFLRFVIVERPQSLKGYAEQAAEIREQVQEWQAAFRVAVSERRWEKLKEDLDKLIKPEDVQKFASSEMVRRAVAVLGQHMGKDGPKTPSQTDYCLVREQETSPT